MTPITIQQDGRDLYVTAPHGLPCPAEQAIDAALSYSERVYDPSGTYLFHRRRQHRPIENGIHCLAGLKVRVCKALSDLGVPYHYVADPYYSSPVFTPDWTGLARGITLRDWQAEALPKLIASDGGGVEAGTGSGKGPLIASLCLTLPKARIHVTSKARDVVANLYDELTKFLGPTVGRCWGGAFRPGRVTVSTADSLYKLKFDADVVIGDEVHELAAPKYVETLAGYKRARMYWFTATFERDDGRHREIEALFGPRVYTLSARQAVAAGNTVPVIVRWVRPDCPYDPAAGVPAGTDREKLGVWRNDYRNQALAAAALAYGPDQQTVVMTKSVEHVCRLRALLPGYTLCYAEGQDTEDRVEKFRDAGLIPTDIPRMTPSRRTELRTSFGRGELKKVVCNYVWSTGVNFRRLGALVRADAAGSTTKDGQIPGRVCRTFEDPAARLVKTHGEIVDSWDDFNHALLDRARGRRSNYRERGYKQYGPKGEDWS